MATNTTTETMADKVAMALGGGLIILGVVVLGLLESIAGRSAGPVNGDGAVPDTVLIDPTIRAGLILVGVIVLLLYAMYAFAIQQHLGE
ncbi:hypothetical protein [Halorhabdus amylolytica]|uniref:hypothetical protein n=1 Tax=Halorhabdus amylolytica TaxID=2559573 RepID=UPI0010AA3BB4|nr:hypothetical protein [Halorhabdus amylolytica]